MKHARDTLQCPLCGQDTTWQGNPHRPFCSERCRLIDLESWLHGRYVVPGDPEETIIPPGDSDPADEPTTLRPWEKT